MPPAKSKKSAGKKRGPKPGSMKGRKKQSAGTATIVLDGGEKVSVADSFPKVRGRLEKAQDGGDNVLHDTTFSQQNGKRVAVNPNRYLYVLES